MEEAELARRSVQYMTLLRRAVWVASGGGDKVQIPRLRINSEELRREFEIGRKPEDVRGRQLVDLRFEAR